jgi:hypothetical protein
MGFQRNLTPSEIAGQVRELRLLDPPLIATNIVFMGMGEPLMNWKAVSPTLSILNSPDGFGIGARHITVSTVGVLPGIIALGQRPEQFRLAISIHAPNDELRQQLMPVNTKYPLAEVIEAAAAFEDLTLSDADDTLRWQDEGAWPNTMRKARFLSAVDHVQLDRLRYVVMQALDGLFQQVDVLIGPFMTGPMLIASNYTGHPCLHLRAGFEDLGTRSLASLASGSLTTGEADAGGKTFTVPQGISLWGRLFDEGPILNLGMALERALGVAEKRPAFPS